MDYYANERWGQNKKILFRFAFLYVLLYTLPEPYVAIPGISLISSYFNSFWNSISVWFGTTILSIDGDINTRFLGSSDRLVDYLRIVACFSISAVGTLFWSVVDHQRLNYRTLNYWFRLHLRYYLFVILFVYGITKVIDAQFLYPNVWRFTEPMGGASPIDLAWSFMGFSASYTFFAGLVEIIAALLLLFRKTITLGACIAAGVLINVLAMNISYDMPVKQFSIHLLLFSFVLLSYDAKRLVHLFILKKSVSLTYFRNVFTDRWDRIGFSMIKLLFVGYIMASSAFYVWQKNQQISSKPADTYLNGIWSIQSYEGEDSATSDLISDDENWRYLMFDNRGYAYIFTTEDNRERYQVETDSLYTSLRLNNGSKDYSFDLKYGNPSIELTKEKDEATVSISMKRYSLVEFLQHNRNVTWIQEFSFNNRTGALE